MNAEKERERELLQAGPETGPFTERLHQSALHLNC